MSSQKNKNTLSVLWGIIIILLVVIIFILFKNRELKNSCNKKQEYFHNLITNRYEPNFLIRKNYNLGDNTDIYKKMILNNLNPFLNKYALSVISSLSESIANDKYVKGFLEPLIAKITNKVFDYIIDKFKDNTTLKDFATLINRLTKTTNPEEINNAIIKYELKDTLDKILIIPCLNQIIDDLSDTKIPKMFDYIINLSYKSSEQLQKAIEDYVNNPVSDKTTVSILNYVKSSLNLKTSETYKKLVSGLKNQVIKQLTDNLKYLVVSEYKTLSSSSLSDLYNMITTLSKLKELFEKYGKILLCGITQQFNIVLRTIISELKFSINIGFMVIDNNNSLVKDAINEYVYTSFDNWFGAPDSEPDCGKIKSLYRGEYNYNGYTTDQSNKFNRMFIISFEKISEKIKNYKYHKNYNSYNYYNNSIMY